MNTHFGSRVSAAVILLCALFSFPSIGGESCVPPSVIEYAGVFQENGLATLPYRMAVIGSELPGEFSMVVFFHGIGERGKDNDKQTTLAYKPLIRYCIANRLKAVLLFPQCPKRGIWARIAPPSTDIPLAAKPTKPMAAAMRLLAEQRSVYAPSRVFAVGASMGGYGVWDLLSRCPTLFSGAVIVSGGGDPAQAVNLRSIPIHVVHGTQDTIVPVARSRSMVQAIWNAGGDTIVYKELPQSRHEIWDEVFDDPASWEWLFSQKTAE